MSDVVTLVSRICLSAVFLLYGWMKLMNVDSIVNNPGTKRFMELVASGAPAPTWLGYLIAAIEVLGGIAILIGFKTRWVAWGFVIWLVLVTLFGHPFWTFEGAARGANQLNFYKNLGLLGGYLLLTLTGAGRFSVDRR